MTHATLVRVAIDGPVATLTLDSPHNRNALSAQLRADLLAALDRAESAEEVRVVVLTSADRVFCAGADMAEARAEGMERGAREIVEIQRRILASSKPVVAVVHGPVRAGGIGIVAAADIVLASTAATFALTEVRLGLAAAIISLTVHARMNPRAAALTTLGGEVFDATTAAEAGLVTRAVEPDALDAARDEVLASLSAGHPQGLRESKRVLNARLLADVEARGEEMATLSAELFASEPAREAMAAFLKK